MNLDQEIPPPPGCGDAARAMWKAVTDACVLEPHELLVLAELADVADTLAALRETIAAGGLFDGTGKVTPAAVELRLQRLLMLRLLADLGVPADGDGPSLGTASAGSRGSYGRRSP